MENLPTGAVGMVTLVGTPWLEMAWPHQPVRSLELQSRTQGCCPSWGAGLHPDAPAWPGGSRGTLSCLGLAAAVTLSLDRTTVLAGFAGFGAGAMARGCLGRKWGSWLAVPLSIPASLDRSFQGGCMLGFTQASSTASVSHLPCAGCPVLGRH